MVTKKNSAIFQKQIVATKMRLLYLLNTNSDPLFFKKCHFYQKFFTATQKTLFFWVFFYFPFPFFCHLFSFASSNIKKTKTKNAHFFSITPFWHPDKLPPPPKNRTPTHNLCLFKTPKNTIKLGENKQKNLGQIFDATLDRFSTQETANLGQIFNSIYIYIVMVDAGCGLMSTTKAWHCIIMSECDNPNSKSPKPNVHEMSRTSHHKMTTILSVISAILDWFCSPNISKNDAFSKRHWCLVRFSLGGATRTSYWHALCEVRVGREVVRLHGRLSFSRAFRT